MRVSIALHDLSYLTDPVETARHGAFYSVEGFLRWAANEPQIERLEVFLPPAVMTNFQAVRAAAERTLQSENRGKGRLSFYAIHHLPEVWADGAPRILRSLDPGYMAKDRYLRDRFAQGPTALSVDTHVIATYDSCAPLLPVLQAESVPYDSLTCLSDSARTAYQQTLRSMGCPEMPFRLDVIPRGINCEHFRPLTATEKAEARRKLGIPIEATVAIYHSRVGAHGKADLFPLIQSFKQVRGPNDWLVISGTGTSDSAYRTVQGWLEDARVVDRTILLGTCPRDEAAIRLGAADFFVLPCDNPSEGLGIAVLEAMACGIPVLVTEWDGMRQAVQDEVNGLLIPTYWIPGATRLAEFSPFIPHQQECLLVSQCVVPDHQAMTTQLHRLFADPKLRHTLGSNARNTALEYRSEVIGAKLVNLFNQQLEDATKETSEERQKRRQQADRLASPTNYQAILSNMATRSLLPTDRLELTALGRSVAEGSAQVPFFEEVVHLVGQDRLMSTLRNLSRGSQTLADLASESTVSPTDALVYTISILMKRCLICIVK